MRLLRRFAPRNDSGSRPRNDTFFALILITAAGALLRFWQLDFGCPNLFFMDEGHFLFFALNMGGTGPDPGIFIHPTLFFYLWLAADVIYILGALALGTFQSLGDAWVLYRQDPTVYFVLGRIVSAVLGTATIPVTYWIGKRLGGARVGLCAAFFLAFSYLHAQYSQSAYIDITLAAFTTLAVLFALLAVQEDKPRWYALAGLAGGLALSTKYNGVLVCYLGPLAAMLVSATPVILSNAKDLSKDGRDPSLALRMTGKGPGVAVRAKLALQGLFGKKAWLSLGCVLGGFTLGTPYWILNWPQFKADALTFWGDYKLEGAGHFGYEGDYNWIYYLQNPLWYGLGLPLLIAGVLGLFFLLLRPKKEHVLLGAFALIYFGVSGGMDVRTPRYAMPLIPVLCVTGAWLAAMLSRWLARPGRGRGILLAVLAALIVLPSAADLLRYNYLKLFPETRLLAHDWIKENVELDQDVLQSFYVLSPPRAGWPKQAHFDATIFDTRVLHASSLRSVAEYREDGFKHLIVDDWHLSIVFNGARNNPKPQYVEAAQRYRNFLEDLEASATLVEEFNPYEEGVDTLDDQNIEFTSRYLWKTRRLGPRIRIYRL